MHILSLADLSRVETEENRAISPVGFDGQTVLRIGGMELFGHTMTN